MEKIKKITIRVNENKKTYYEYNGEKFESAQRLLEKIFKDQGELYEKIYHVSREDAELAGWGPRMDYFDTTSYGWVKFLHDKGKIHKEIIEEELSVEEFVRDYVGF